MTEINEREAMCLESGCTAFWIVDPQGKTVKVSTPDRRTTPCIEGDRVPLKIFGAGELGVAEISNP